MSDFGDILARIQKAVETDDWLELKPDEAAALSARLAPLEQVADAAREVVNDGTSRTALARLAATVHALDAQEPA